MPNEFKVGTSQAGLTLLSQLTVPVPEPFCEFVPYSKQSSLSDGNVRGNGFPQAKWDWKFLTSAQRDQLRSFCAGASSSVWIRTWDEEGDYHDFNCIMIWPAEQDPQAERFLEFTLVFRRLVEYEDLP